MQLEDAINLIHHESIATAGSTWMDLGCGTGLFTYALCNILLNDGKIFALDKTSTPLTQLPNPNNTTIIQQKVDFEMDSIDIVNLDGILMANSLHYVRDKKSFLNKISKTLKNNGCFLIVEYDTQKANPWVPYPIDYIKLFRIFEDAGFTSGIKLGETDSVYSSNKIYAAIFRRKIR